MRLSSLWRSLSPRNPQHLAMALTASAAAGVRLAVDLSAGDAPAAAVAAAINAAVTVFLGWAVARELDPDRPASALWAAAVTAGLLLVVGSAPAGAMVALLFALRVASRSTGAAPTVLDLLFLLLLAGAVAATPRGWIGGLAVAVALAWDSALPQPAPARNRVAALAAAAATVAVAVAAGTLEVGPVRPEAASWAAFALGLAGFLLARSYEPAARQDRGGSAVSGPRMKAARRLGMATGLAAALMFGGAAVPLLAGLWAALAAIGIDDRLGRHPEDRFAG